MSVGEKCQRVRLQRNTSEPRAGSTFPTLQQADQTEGLTY